MRQAILKEYWIYATYYYFFLQLRVVNRKRREGNQNFLQTIFWNRLQEKMSIHERLLACNQ